MGVDPVTASPGAQDDHTPVRVKVEEDLDGGRPVPPGTDTALLLTITLLRFGRSPGTQPTIERLMTRLADLSDLVLGTPAVLLGLLFAFEAAAAVGLILWPDAGLGGLAFYPPWWLVLLVILVLSMWLIRKVYTGVRRRLLRAYRQRLIDRTPGVTAR